MPCSRCEGEGFITKYDPGEFWGAPCQIPYSEECPDCLDQGLCPVCLEPLMVIHPDDPGNVATVCSDIEECGWKDE